MAVVAIADLYGIRGRRNELVALLAEAEREAVAQPGCLRYSFAATLADLDRFVLVSEWRDTAAMDARLRLAGVRSVPVLARRPARPPERHDGLPGQRIGAAGRLAAHGSARRGLTRVRGQRRACGAPSDANSVATTATGISHHAGEPG